MTIPGPFERQPGHHLRLVLSAALFVVAVVSVVIFALLELPSVLVVALSLAAALALVDFAGTLASDRPVRSGWPH
ncbi:hypothetical protein FB561_2964 [Kribbella amoyensis]|uniref:Uncharacterized protein n=1 Tax=Kribbella amoyensis TaxID=996641 RepID=A0A561BSH2_9ACTN|nr:hypothetical protein [Kribbella amoyensis]TWD81840.1 hypothetical protein FB561_2964 [Kribbella amoyensis]